MNLPGIQELTDQARCDGDGRTAIHAERSHRCSTTQPTGIYGCLMSACTLMVLAITHLRCMFHCRLTFAGA